MKQGHAVIHDMPPPIEIVMSGIEKVISGIYFLNFLSILPKFLT